MAKAESCQPRTSWTCTTHRRDQHHVCRHPHPHGPSICPNIQSQQAWPRRLAYAGRHGKLSLASTACANIDHNADGLKIFGIGVTVCVILAAQLYGWNIHVWDLTKTQAETGRQVSLAAQTLFLFSSGLAKNSILVSYLRIAPARSWLRRLTYASIVIVTSLIFAFLIVLWTQCR